MMAGNPYWWSMHPPTPNLLSSSQYVFGSSSLPSSTLAENQDPPQSWSHLLLGGSSASEEERSALSHHFQYKKQENWEDHVFSSIPRFPAADSIKQEAPQNSNLFGHKSSEDFQASSRPAWSHMMAATAASSPRSCVTSLSSSNILDFSYNKVDGKNQGPDHSSECNSTATCGGCNNKKPRVQPSSSQPPLKVRKEKLGDRITALHQLVSPFGKTDTASVLLEAIGYIRFLQGQIEALSFPYIGSASKNMRNSQQFVQRERGCVFPEDPGQLLNDTCLKRKVAPNQGNHQEKPKDLRSRGLCLVPLSCTQLVGSDNGADYWAPAAYGGRF